MLPTLEAGRSHDECVVMDAPWNGARIRDIREQAGLNQYAAARAISAARRRRDSERGIVAQAMLSQWENNKRTPDADDIYDFCEAMHCNCTDLYKPVGTIVRFRGGKPVDPGTDETVTEE